jgi:hypothetical protein
VPGAADVSQAVERQFLFSLDTFFPVIDLSGVKSWGWTVSERYRWVVLSERVLGFVISALAAYSIGSFVFD